MLRSMKELCDYTVEAAEGKIGEIEDCYFDDDSWLIRYLVINTRNWLPRPRVFLTPTVLEQPDWERKVVKVALTKEQIGRSPEIDPDEAISRQQETELHDYYGWPTYWTDPDILETTSALPGPGPVGAGKESCEPQLHSTRNALGYRIQARDGEIGRLADFITDDETWSIYYLVGDTQGQMSQAQVLIAPEWLKAVNWAESEIHVDLLCETLKNSIEYDPSALIDREYEEQLQDPLRVVLKAIWASKRPKLPA